MTRHLPTAAATLIAALLAVPAIRHLRERPPDPPPPSQPLRAAWSPGANIEAGGGTDYPFGLALAPDGRRLVYPAAKAGVVTLFLQDLRNGETRELPGTTGGVAPFWSPDGTRIGFFADARLRVLDLDAGTTSTLMEAAAPRGAAWNAAGDIVFAPVANGGLMKRAADGTIAPFTALDAAAGETAHAWPAFLDEGRVVFLVSARDRSRAGIWIAELDAPESRRRLIAADAQPIVVGTEGPSPSPQGPNAKPQGPSPKPQAHILLVLNDQTLLAYSLDEATGQMTNRGTPVGLMVGHGPLGQTFATATHDVLLYGAPGTTLRQLQWVTREGNADGPPSEPIDAWDLRLSPDGRRIAITEVDPQLRTLDVFIRTGSQPAPLRLSLSTDLDESGVWSPDGLRVAWAGRRRQVMIRGAGAVLPEQTIVSLDAPIQVWDWSRDGRSLLVGRTHPDTRDDLWIQPPVEGAEARAYVTAPFNQSFGVFSPDGRWVAYASDESGKFDIYIDAFPMPGARVRVTTAGGTEPRWHRDGSELYFRRGSELHAVTLTPAGKTLEVAAINRLFDAGAVVRSYDVSPDGRRFLLNLPASSTTRTPITLVHHWSAFAQTLRRDKSAFAQTLRRDKSASSETLQRDKQ